MTISINSDLTTQSAIFKSCKEQCPWAVLVQPQADVNIIINNTIDHLEFELLVRDGIATITGGSTQSVLWGFYEYLERFFGANWPTPYKSFVSKEQVTPFRNITVRYIHSYEFCEFHKTVSKSIRNWLNIHRCVSRRKRETYVEKCHQVNWYELYGATHPHIFARSPEGNIVDKGYIKFKFDNPDFIQMVADQLNGMKGEFVNLFPTDGVQFDATALSGKNPLYTYRGWYSMTEYFLKYYSAIASLVPNKMFDIYAYSAYSQFPDNSNFDGSRFYCFFSPSDDFINFIRWKESGCKMIYRTNRWNDGSPTDEKFLKEAEVFRRIKSIGFDGYAFDGFKNDWDTYGLRYYLTARITYKNATVDTIANEYLRAISQ